MIDFNDPAFVADPYEALKSLRLEGKPVWHDQMQIFLAARHSDANDVFRNKSLGRIFKDKTPEFEWETFNWLHSDSILDSEPPKHTRLRSLVAKAFNRNKIEGMRPAVERITAQLLDAIDEKVKSGENFDLITDYAEPLPVKIIADLLGFPESDEHLLRPWSQSIVKMYEVNPSQEYQIEAKKAALEKMAKEVHDWDLAHKKAMNEVFFENTAQQGHDIGGVRRDPIKERKTFVGQTDDTVGQAQALKDYRDKAQARYQALRKELDALEEDLAKLQPAARR